MMKHFGTAVLCLGVVAAAAWIAGKGEEEKKKSAGDWVRVAPGVFRSPGLPAGYALVAGDRALLIDAPRGAEGLKAHGVKTVDAVLLTHHHRDSAAWAGRFLADRVSVRAPKVSAAWLMPAGVRQYWCESLPLRNSRTAYLVLPEGLDGVDCSLTDGQTIDPVVDLLRSRGLGLRHLEEKHHALEDIFIETVEAVEPVEPARRRPARR